MNMEESNYNTFVATTGVLCGVILFILISLSIGQLTGLPRISQIPILNLIPYTAYLAFGLVLVAVWLPISIAGIYTIGHRGAVGMSGHLINYGIYHYVRNPMYSGIFFTLLGTGLIANSLGIIIASLIWLVVSIFECRRELKGLEDRFGKDYKTYERETPFFIPNFGKMFWQR